MKALSITLFTLFFCLSVNADNYKRIVFYSLMNGDNLIIIQGDCEILTTKKHDIVCKDENEKKVHHAVSVSPYIAYFVEDFSGSLNYKVSYKKDLIIY